MTQGGGWASLGNHSLPVSAKVVSGPLPTPAACDFVAVGTGRAVRALQRRDCRMQELRFTTNLSKRLKAQ